MNPVKIIETFLEKGIILSAEENQLRFNAPVGALTAELRQILTENKHALLEHLQKRHADSATTISELRPNLARPPIPLSFAQERLWFLDQWEPGSTAYQLSYAWRLHGLLNPSALETSLQELAARHSSLRTTFSSFQGLPIQVIAPVASVSLALRDLAALPEPTKEIELQRLIYQGTRQPFYLTIGPLWRTQLLRLAPQEHVLILILHHIITDGWSMRIFLKELMTIYNAKVTNRPTELPPQPLQYADFAVWQRHWLQGEELDRQLSYWRMQLDGTPSSLGIPTDFPRPPQPTYRGERLPFTLPVPLTQAIKTLSQQEGVTLFMTILSAFQILLFRHTGQRDILVGAPIAGRTQTDLEGLIGFFVNTLVLRTQFKGQPTFRDILRQVRETCLEAYAHQDLPFEKLVETLQPARDLSRHPLFQVMFQLFGQPSHDFSFSGLHIAPEPIPHQSAKFDLNCTLRETADSLEGTMEYCTDLFTLDTIQRMVCHYQHLLEGIVANPDQQIATLPILLKAERQQLLVQGTNTSRNYPPHTCVSELFEAQVTRTPEAIAVVFEEQQLTYRELNARANQLAHVLRGRGVGPDVRVGLCLERGVELITSLLGILKAGGAYVPLDPTYPEERLRYILTDSNPHCIVTQHGLIQGLEDIACPRIYLDRDWAFCAPFSVQNILSSNTGLSMAYLIYTSGSTGQPKGVMVTHEAVINLLLTLQEHVGVDQTAVILAVTSLSFDISVFELLGPLIVGGRLVLTSREDVTDGVALIAALQSHGITVMQATPTTWHMLLQASHTTPLGSLEIICGGEPMTTDLARRLQPWGSKILNAYGPTETTIWSTIFKVESPEDRIPIGWPLANTTAFLIDRVGELVPMGVAGEILIGGDGVARGYHRRPDLTAEKFMPDAFGTSPGERLYKTGDLARYRPDRRLDCLGRLDHQVKIRGFRIELGEIEAALIHHPAVHDAVVLCREDSPGSKQLVGYVVVADTRRPSTTDLVAWLKRSLPDYMLPSVFVLLDTLPLTPNGKIDRRALPVPDPTHRARTAAYVPPTTPLEELVADIWQDLLRVNQISVHDNFFALGGHSLLATQVVSRTRALLHTDLSVRTLFEGPTIAQLAKNLEIIGSLNLADQALPLRPQSHEGPLPLSFAQQRLWFLDQLEPGSAAYLLPYAWRIQGPLDIQALTAILTALVARHESLRTTFPTVDGHPEQMIAPMGPASLTLHDLTALLKPTRDTEVQRLIHENAHQPVDLATGPLWRAQLLRLGPEEHVFLLTFHHIITDGWSMGIMFQELSMLYSAQVASQPAMLPPLPVQYADFAIWQRQWLQGDVLDRQVTYWHSQLAEAPPSLDLPTDFPRPLKQTYQGACQAFTIPQPLTQALKALSQQEGVTLFMTLLAAFQLLLFRYTGQRDILVGTPIAGRTHTDLEGLIGFFVNTLVIRTPFKGESTFRDILRQVRKTCLDAYAHQDLPFEKLVEALQPVRDPSRHPLFQVMFQLDYANPSKQLTLPPLDVVRLATVSQTARFDLWMGLVLNGESLKGTVTFNTDLFETNTITQLTTQYHTLLAGLVADPTRAITHLPLLTDAERHQLLVEWNPTDHTPYPTASIQALFEAQVARTPDAIAVMAPDTQVTYAALNQQANQLAHFLRRRGVGPEVRVGVCLEPSVDLIISLWAILKADGVYVPLDPTYPSTRLAIMIEDSQVSLILTHKILQEALPTHSPKFVFFETLAPQLILESSENPARRSLPHNLAYLIYTSGSSGNPKGVLVSHQGLGNVVLEQQRFFQSGPETRVLQFASISFDASLAEILMALQVGGTLIIETREALRPGPPLFKVLRQHAITLVTFPPSLLAILPHESLPALATLMVAGEHCPSSVIERWSPGRRFFNLYGPTEGTIWSTVADYHGHHEATTSSIGRPIAHTTMYVLDSHFQPAPSGVPGEAVIGGIGLARGYLNHPALTAQQFVPNPFSQIAGSRLYKTGDRVRYQEEKRLAYLGRMDQQVKLRGYRIELGEIESVLSQHPAVQNTVVLCREDSPGEIQLVAYVVLALQVTLSPATIRQYLQTQLPDYMLPAAIVVLDTLPLTPNGKVNRRALPVPDQTHRARATAYLSPRTPVEELVAEMWQDLLKVDQISVHDNFFALGGHSLLVTQVIARLRNMLELDLPLRTLFEHPTVAQLAKEIDTQLANNFPDWPKDESEARPNNNA